MEIRKAKREDLDRILAIYERARAFMVSAGNPRQWAASNWPPKDLIEEDIKAGRSYVMTEGGVVHAVFCLICGHDIDPTYRKIEDGAWIGNEDYGVIHRLASDGEIRGIGNACLSFCYEKCGHLRADTHPDNKPMQGVFKKMGFQYCGIIHVVEDNDPRYAYERL